MASLRSRLKRFRKRVQRSRAAARVARGLAIGGAGVGAVVGGPVGAALGSAAFTGIGAGLIRPERRRKFIKRGLTVGAGVTAGTGLLSLAAGTGVTTPALTSISQLFGTQEQIPAVGQQDKLAFSIEDAAETAPSATASGLIPTLGQVATAALGTQTPAGLPSGPEGPMGPFGVEGGGLGPGSAGGFGALPGTAEGMGIPPIVLLGGGLALLALLA